MRVEGGLAVDCDMACVRLCARLCVRLCVRLCGCVRLCVRINWTVCNHFFRSRHP